MPEVTTTAPTYRLFVRYLATETPQVTMVTQDRDLADRLQRAVAQRLGAGGFSAQIREDGRVELYSGAPLAEIQAAWERHEETAVVP